MSAGLLATIVFIGMLLCSGLLVLVLRAQKEEWRHRLAERLGPGRDIPQILHKRRLDFWGELLGSAGRWLFELRLRAGQPGPVGDVVTLSAMLALGATGMLAWFLNGPVVMGGLLAGAIPVLVLSRGAAERARLMGVQIPEALDLMSRALRAGHSFSEAMRTAASELPKPIGEELSLTSEQHRLGLELRECLDGLVLRNPESFELRMLVGAVMLNRDTGGNLIEILDHLSGMIRERVVFEGKVKALTAEVRTSAYVLGSLPFGAAGLLIIMQPDYLLPLLEPGLGRILLSGGCLSMFIGVMLMRKLATVEM